MSLIKETDEVLPKILVVCNYYLPGYKRGGGLRTVVNMVERFKDKFEFWVVTRDHDGDKISYNSVKVDDWNKVDGAKVFYLPQDKVKLSKLRELILQVEPDAIYLNSIFSTLTIFVLTLRKLKLIPSINVIVAPEGELSDGALQLKAMKKKAFIKLAQSTGLYRNIFWKTTAELEEIETRRFEQRGGKFFIAPNLPSSHLSETFEENLKPKKKSGEAKIIFLSRYMRKKNFKWLVENLKNIKGKLVIDIVGPIEDVEYWKETEPLLENLPHNIKIAYRGELEYEQVMSKLTEYHFFILPTLGENFGHVFIEALAAGCPLIISDRTPWLDLENKQIGWDIPLEDPSRWQEIINHCIGLDELSYTKLTQNSRKFALQWIKNPEVEENTLKVLENSLQMG